MKQSLLCLIVLVVFFVNGCGPSADEYNAIKKENESLKIEVSNLKKEVEELKFGASRLFATGKQNFEEGNFEAAKTTFETLLAKHPDASESKEAIKLLDKTISEIKKKTEIEAAKKEREEQEKKRRLAEATKKMTRDYDKLEEITWYKDSSTQPLYTSFHLYFGQKKTGNPWLRLNIRYYANDWLFISSFFIVVDGQKFEKPITKFARDHGYGSIWEWYDDSVSSADMVMVKSIIKSKTATIRFIGSQYHKDYTITAQEKKALQNVLDAFEALGGQT